MRAPVYFVPLVLLFVSCQLDNPDSNERGQKSEYIRRNPASLAHFEAAEQQVAVGRYIFAAKYLNKGIVAFRSETGKMSGSDAVRANRAIDTLTRLRKTLRHGEAVIPEDLHRAILKAMESEPMRASSVPKPSREIFVPVSGN